MTTAAAWMDRLSDWIGSLIPGGYRLPARHPVKVSLVMGVLGGFSGWVTMIIGSVLEQVCSERFQSNGFPYYSASGLMFAALVAAPWACWLNASLKQVRVIILSCFLMNLVCHWMAFLRPAVVPIDETYGLLVGVCFAIVGLLTVKQVRILWALATIAITGLGQRLGNLNFYWDHPAMIIRSGLQWFANYLDVAGFFSMIHLSVALCLGFLVWDATPRPKFEPQEPDARAAD